MMKREEEENEEMEEVFSRGAGNGNDAVMFAQFGTGSKGGV